MEDEVYNFMREIELLLFDKFGLQKGLRQSPHITVKPPFIADSIAPYVKYMESLCAGLEAFEIELDGFNSFSSKVIYLDVKENPNLFAIHEKITSDFKKEFNRNEKEEMIFHATLAYGDVDEETFKKAFEYLKAHFKPKFKFKPQKMGLFYQLPDDSGWIVVKEQKLFHIS